MLEGHEYYVTDEGELLERRITTSPVPHDEEFAVWTNRHFVGAGGSLWECGYLVYPAPCGRGLIAWVKHGREIPCACPAEEQEKIQGWINEANTRWYEENRRKRLAPVPRAA